jgi:hypothetical protein
MPLKALMRQKGHLSDAAVCRGRAIGMCQSGHGRKLRARACLMVWRTRAGAPPVHSQRGGAPRRVQKQNMLSVQLRSPSKGRSASTVGASSAASSRGMFGLFGRKKRAQQYTSGPTTSTPALSSSAGGAAGARALHGRPALPRGPPLTSARRPRAGSTGVDLADAPSTSGLGSPIANNSRDIYARSLPLPAGKVLQLRSAVCYLPHPEKASGLAGRRTRPRSSSLGQMHRRSRHGPAGPLWGRGCAFRVGARGWHHRRRGRGWRLAGVGREPCRCAKTSTTA